MEDYIKSETPQVKLQIKTKPFMEFVKAITLRRLPAFIEVANGKCYAMPHNDKRTYVKYVEEDLSTISDTTVDLPLRIPLVNVKRLQDLLMTYVSNDYEDFTLTISLYKNENDTVWTASRCEILSGKLKSLIPLGEPSFMTYLPLSTWNAITQYGDNWIAKFTLQDIDMSNLRRFLKIYREDGDDVSQEKEFTKFNISVVQGVIVYSSFGSNEWSFTIKDGVEVNGDETLPTFTGFDKIYEYITGRCSHEVVIYKTARQQYCVLLSDTESKLQYLTVLNTEA